MISFRPLTGINFNIEIEEEAALSLLFPSPHGDKFQRHLYLRKLCAVRFRPLTGINFNRRQSGIYNLLIGFRPLTGINFNLMHLRKEKNN